MQQRRSRGYDAGRRVIRQEGGKMNDIAKMIEEWQFACDDQQAEIPLRHWLKRQGVPMLEIPALAEKIEAELARRMAGAVAEAEAERPKRERWIAEAAAAAEASARREKEPRKISSQSFEEWQSRREGDGD